MKATVMYGAKEVQVQNVPDATIVEPTDALVRVVRSCICGSDLWPYRETERNEAGQQIGHEAIGVVEAVGSGVQKIKQGDFVIMPFAFSDGHCDFCEEGLNTACVHGGFFGVGEVAGAQAEAVRVPLADGTLYSLPGSPDEALLASLLTLSDVMGTGHHAAVGAKVAPGKRVAVVGGGAVGLCGVIAAKRMGAEQIILMDRNQNRIELGHQFGATDIVKDRGSEAVERVLELTNGQGVHSTLECVGTGDAMKTSVEIARPGGAIGRVGVPHYENIPESGIAFFKNLSVSGGPAPVRSYIADLLPDVMDGSIQPGRVFDSVINIDQVPDGYRQMDERQAIKVMINF